MTRISTELNRGRGGDIYDADRASDEPGGAFRQIIRVAGALGAQLAAVLDGTPAADALGLVVRVVGGATEATLGAVQDAVEAVRDRLPAALVGGRLAVDAAVSSLPTDTYSVATTSSSVSGNAAAVTPAAGKKVRLHYLSLNADGANSADVTAALRFGAAGALRYTQSLKAGAIFARNIGAGRRYVEGAVDEALYLNLSAAQTVNVTVEYEEV